MELDFIFLILILTLHFCVGLIVYFNNRKSKSNVLFAVMIFWLIVWTAVSFIEEEPINRGAVSILVKMDFASAILLAYFFFLFCRDFLVRNLFTRINDFWFFLPAGLFSLFSFTNLVIHHVEFYPEWRYFVPGPFYPMYILLVFAYIITGVTNLFTKYRHFRGIKRIQTQYVLIGLVLTTFIVLTTNIIIPNILKIPSPPLVSRIGIYSTLLFIVFTSYAIIKHHLFNIKVIATALFTAIVGLILFIQAIVASSLVIKILNTGIFLLFCLFGYFLVKSVIREVELRQEVEKLSQAKSEFISIASHQLRTPLTAIKGYISMMLEKSYGNPPTKMEKPLDNIYASNERLIRLVNDLLNLSRLEAGKIDFNPELTSLEELVSGVIQDLRINVEKKGLYIKIVKPSEPLPKIMFDQDKIRQVILNIMDNAIKYTKEGGITIKLEKLNLEEQIKISDTGEGMDEKEIQSLFQIFSRATAGTQLHTEGAGIGLYVARQFVEMHGGKIWAESLGKGKGSTFIVQLPIHLSPKLLKSKTRTIINK